MLCRNQANDLNAANACREAKLVGDAHTLFQKAVTMIPTHRESKTRLYMIWKGMKARCRCKSTSNYALYGGAGIDVCDEWKRDFIAFKNWAIENGYKDNLSIDRINSGGNYEPGNCRWATQRQQNENRRKRRTACTSVFKGVYRDGKAIENPWRARIKQGGKFVSLGRHKYELHAALAYDDAARLLYMGFARTNFPERASSYTCLSEK